jgi:hypothetical protein
MLGGSSAKPSTQMAFDDNKTTHTITFNGIVYSQLTKSSQDSAPLASGIDTLVNLKLQAHKGRKFYIVGNDGTKYKGGSKGE